MLTPRHASSQIPPLPASFDDQERRTDAQITQALGVDANMVPEGLADRVLVQRPQAERPGVRAGGVQSAGRKREPGGVR